MGMMKVGEICGGEVRKIGCTVFWAGGKLDPMLYEH
jgi:hypothetical protein